jgi:hypothetical protein
MAKKGGDSSPAADAQARIAQQLFSQTDPIRSALIGRSAGFLGVGGAPTSGGMKDGGGVPQSGGGGVITDMIRRGMPSPVPGSPAAGAPPLVTGFGDVTATPTFQAFKESTGQNFAKAKDRAISGIAPGGALTEALVDLEGQKASALTQGAGAIYEDELARAMALGTGLTGTSMGGLGQAAATQAGIAQANADRDAGKSGALGSGVGAVMGKK